MPINVGQEMALPMEQIIGGPLQAVIKAQSLAASTTVDFIQQVGLTGDGTDQVARTVAFSFDRNVPDTDEAGDDIVRSETVNLNVPLLTIVPVPFIRIATTDISFECKVSSSTINSSDMSLGVSAEASGGFWGVKVGVKSSFSYNTKSTDTVNRSATLKVDVHAVQDEIPKGLDRILTILETAITDSDTTPAPA
ncbi:MAG TPA: DUF2589 domain-containing protein [Nocardioidaceae bacterium]